VHHGSLPLIHVDAYRLLIDGQANLYLDDLDLDSALSDSVTVVEWGGAEAARLSDERLEINIDRSVEVRQVSAEGIGARWAGFTL
jgi:tRNA threonylcarbamoyladenosine biosynthesis protein TsaE